MPYVAALEMSGENRPIHLRHKRVSRFTRVAIKTWSVDSLAPGSVMLSGGLACFRAGASGGCDHFSLVIGGRKPKEVPVFQ